MPFRMDSAFSYPCLRGANIISAVSRPSMYPTSPKIKAVSLIAPLPVGFITNPLACEEYHKRSGESIASAYEFY